ncbi:MAG TPA: DNA-3-methyladenine glycosylase I [Balneolaceae bacterium]|nr:DNA-3-methyladenine glycosylase I [Balneolaceae bacterium]
MALKRCPWCENTFDQYVRYHDEEWGVPVYDDQKQFEFLTLESAQAGLSWSTILKRREGYRNAFAEFKPEKVAYFDEQKIQELLQNPAIIRNELKIRSAVNNAQRFIEIQDEFGSFADYIWSFVDGKPVQNEWTENDEVPATTELSDRLAKDLKKRGFKFVGSTIMYAHLQATGLINDHLISCFRHQEVKELV